jgi:hypothetical protein
LLRAVARISSDAECDANLRARHGSPFGGPQELMSTLASNPRALIGSQPPADIYGQAIWFAGQVVSAARTASATLAQLPALTEAWAHLPEEDISGLIRGVIDGPGGLVETAENVAQKADEFRRRIGDDAGSRRKDAFAAFLAAGGELQRQVTGLASGKAENLADLQATAEGVGRRIRAHLDNLELSAASVGVAAVLDNLTAALKQIASAWRTAGQSMSKAIAAADPQELSDPAYLKTALNLDEAVKEWAAFADASLMLVQGSVKAI